MVRLEHAYDEFNTPFHLTLKGKGRAMKAPFIKTDEEKPHEEVIMSIGTWIKTYMRKRFRAILVLASLNDPSSP